MIAALLALLEASLTEAPHIMEEVERLVAAAKSKRATAQLSFADMSAPLEAKLEGIVR